MVEYQKDSTEDDNLDYRRAQLKAAHSKLCNNDDFRDFMAELYKSLEANQKAAYVHALKGEVNQSMAYLMKASGLHDAIGEFNILEYIDLQSSES